MPVGPVGGVLVVASLVLLFGLPVFVTVVWMTMRWGSIQRRLLFPLCGIGLGYVAHAIVAECVVVLLPVIRDNGSAGHARALASPVLTIVLSTLVCMGLLAVLEKQFRRRAADRARTTS